MIRLADRILAGNVEVPRGSRLDPVLLPHEIEGIGLADVVVFDNVTDYFFSHFGSLPGWGPSELCPNAAPPFEHIFLETRSPARVQSPSDPSLQESWPAKEPFEWGFHVVAQDLRSSEPARYKPSDDAWLSTVLPREPRWLLEMVLYKGWGEIVTGPHAMLRLAVLSDGTLLGAPAEICVYAFDEPDVAGERAQDYLSDVLLWYTQPALLAISFMHCRNVEMREVAPARPVRRQHERRTGRAPVTYRVLQIQPMTRVLKSEGAADETGLARALHICRGHFKDYREHGLFGRHKGIYWWGDYVRGDMETGIALKDYDVSGRPKLEP